MAKLNQIIAISSGKKTEAQKAITKVHHSLEKVALLSGIQRVYQPKDDEGERLPSESKRVQCTVKQGVRDAAAAWSELFDIVPTQDRSNCAATADIKVDGATLATAVPVSTLLFLEKQLVDIHTFVKALPLLNPERKWEWDETTGSYKSDVVETVRTKKVPRTLIKYEATPEHPAQVDVWHEDVLVGRWATTEFSGCMLASDRDALLARVCKLQQAVKFAREEANSITAVELKLSKPLLGYLFGSDT